MDQGLHLPGPLFLFLSVPFPSPSSHQTSALQLQRSNTACLTPELPQRSCSQGQSVAKGQQEVS